MMGKRKLPRHALIVNGLFRSLEWTPERYKIQYRRVTDTSGNDLNFITRIKKSIKEFEAITGGPSWLYYWSSKENRWVCVNLSLPEKDKIMKYEMGQRSDF
jgi:hypothetical protein